MSLLASSLPLGLSWGLASLFLGPLGYAAEHVGLTAMLTAVSLLPVVTAALALRLPHTAPPARSG